MGFNGDMVKMLIGLKCHGGYSLFLGVGVGVNGFEGCVVMNFYVFLRWILDLGFGL